MLQAQSYSSIPLIFPWDWQSNTEWEWRNWCLLWIHSWGRERVTPEPEFLFSQWPEFWFIKSFASGKRRESKVLHGPLETDSSPHPTGSEEFSAHIYWEAIMRFMTRAFIHFWGDVLEMKINQLERCSQQNAFGYKNRIRTLRKRDFGKSINKQNQALMGASTVAKSQSLLTELQKHP